MARYGITLVRTDTDEVLAIEYVDGPLVEASDCLMNVMRTFTTAINREERLG